MKLSMLIEALRITEGQEGGDIPVVYDDFEEGEKDVEGLEIVDFKTDNIGRRVRLIGQ